MSGQQQFERALNSSNGATPPASTPAVRSNAALRGAAGPQDSPGEDLVIDLTALDGPRSRLSTQERRAPVAAMPVVEVTVVVPTFNEGGNVPELVERLSSALRGIPAEILVVDDSTDDTPQIVQAVAARSALPVRLMHRRGKQRTGGLSGAVTAGLRAARGDYVVVMDGDLQHPPEIVPLLLHEARHGRADVVVASRYLGDGDASGLADGWRRGVSFSSTALARLLFPHRVGRRCSDPMTGFFCVQRQSVHLDRLRPRGFKILLEILARHRLTVREVPFVFGERRAGESKASWRQGLLFLRQLIGLRLASLMGLPVVLLLVVLALAALLRSTPLLDATLLMSTLVLLVVALISVCWQSYAWRTPAHLERTGLAEVDEPRLSFSVVVPARHEQAVLGQTIAGIAAIDHPDFEIVIVVGHDDPDTHAAADAAAAAAGVPTRVVVDHHEEKNKPKALNTGLPFCRGDVVMVIDAEDDVQPGLLRLADAALRRDEADIVQTGVQLMDFDKSWWSGRNVLEYFFWFRSRLHFHAAQRFIPLGGTGVGVRRDLIEHLGGWDESCLAEDCDLGVRASVRGARVSVVYEPRHTTLEETPTDVGALFRQRVRWMQGFIQVLVKRDWRRLPTRRQRLQAAIVLSIPLTQALAGVVAPLSAVTAVAFKAPVGLVLLAFLPLVPAVVSLLLDMLALADFGRTFSRRIGWRSYAWLAASLPVYQLLLSAAAVWALVRHVRGRGNWDKTRHVNAHRSVREPAEAAS